MDRMDDLAAFLAIVEKGSQSAAARHLRRSLQSINRSLTALEQSIGAELISRTTRRSNPTEAGLAFYHRVKPAFVEIGDAKREAADSGTELSGLLRIGSPVLFAPAYVAPVACEFMERNPGIEIELRVSDHKIDLIEGGLDLAVRIRELSDSALKARRIGELRTVVFGAPAYFEKFGRPKHPSDLVRHHCVIRITEPDADRWPFRVAGRSRTVRVQGRFRSDGTAVTHAAVAQGIGIGLAPLWQIRSLVDAGAVEIVLQEFETAKTPVHAVWPPTKVPSAKTRLFTEFLAARLKRARF